MTEDENLVMKVSTGLKSRLENYSERNEISQAGAVRMILNQNLPEGEA